MSVSVHRVTLVEGVGAAFAGGANLAHTRPHEPAQLARARSDLAIALGVEVDDFHLMRQVHGADVHLVDEHTPSGAEVRGVDALVTDEPGRVLVVQAADCVPVLIAAEDGRVGVAHAGRVGVELGVVPALVAAMAAAGSPPATLHAAVGPAIGACCYEVPEELAEAFRRRSQRWAADTTDVVATTTWGTPSLDLPLAVTRQLAVAGVHDAQSTPVCTRCGGQDDWFSHRRDPSSGRHWGVVWVERDGRTLEAAA